MKHPAHLLPFEIALSYQSDAHEEEYRKLPKGTRPIARLRYVPKITSAKSTSGTIRADRAQKILIKPDMDIRGNFRTKAVIDKLVILLETHPNTDPVYLNKKIKRETQAVTYVHDLLSGRDPGKGWGAPLMKLDHSKLIGAPFAIMIQEPTPDALTAILKVIEDGPGIEGPVLLHLIEVSVDFHPKTASTPEEAVFLNNNIWSVAMTSDEIGTSENRRMPHGPF